MDEINVKDIQDFINGANASITISVEGAKREISGEANAAGVLLAAFAAVQAVTKWSEDCSFEEVLSLLTDLNESEEALCE